MTTILGENLDNKQSINAQVEAMHIPRFSYRKKFQPLEGNLTTDRRWGCSIRCCQNILAQFIKKSYILTTNQYVNQFFSNISKINAQIPNSHSIHNTANSLFNIPKIAPESKTHNSHSSSNLLSSSKKIQKILQTHGDYPQYFHLFFDTPTSPFSIHSFCSELKKLNGTPPGKWVKLSTLSFIIKKLLSYSEIETIIAEDGQISRPLIFDAFKKYQSSQPNKNNTPPIPKPNIKKEDSDTKQKHQENNVDTSNNHDQQDQSNKLPVLILIPLMLGLKKLETESAMVITKALSLPKQSIGVIGGKNGKAYYIVGFTDKDEFLYFDPHEIHDAVVKHDDLYRVYEPELHKIKKNQLNTSIMIGFIVKNGDDVNEIEEAMKGTPITISNDYIEYSFQPNDNSDESSKTTKPDIQTHDKESDDSDSDDDIIIVS